VVQSSFGAGDARKIRFDFAPGRLARGVKNGRAGDDCAAVETVRFQEGNKKSALDFSVKDAPAALPQNCQTTTWIVEAAPSGVNVTLVMRNSSP
jgi:hypothetical protein